MDYIKLRNRNPVINDSAIRRLINTYISEAAAEDVNYDIAIAQMLYWTAFLSNRQRVESNNFGGLSSTREWNGRFPYMMRNDGLTEGVRAHIQHLRGYASSTLKNPSTVNVDPRWNFLERIHGTVRTFDQVYPVWTQDAHRYRLNMNMILDKLYEYSDNRSSR
ncbi:MAG: glucosaminidase domain-containing protein [Treponema sp.]|nr:glucosaminidase domain-containing protein [Treponema sp.]